MSGASSGLGLATAEALAAEGANVTMFARRRDVLERHRDRGGLRRSDEHEHAALVALALDHDPVLPLRVAVDADHRDLLRPAPRRRRDLGRIARARQDHAQTEHQDEAAETAELQHGRPDLPGSVIASSIDLPHRASQPRAAPETAGDGTATLGDHFRNQ